MNYSRFVRPADSLPYRHYVFSGAVRSASTADIRLLLLQSLFPSPCSSSYHYYPQSPDRLPPGRRFADGLVRPEEAGHQPELSFVVLVGERAEMGDCVESSLRDSRGVRRKGQVVHGGAVCRFENWGRDGG